MTLKEGVESLSISTVELRLPNMYIYVYDMCFYNIIMIDIYRAHR